MYGYVMYWGINVMMVCQRDAILLKKLSEYMLYCYLLYAGMSWMLV